MKFRDDIDLEKTWVTADSHFGHGNIVGFCARPTDHEQIMMEEWARDVPDDGTLLHLGDLCYRGNAFFKNMIAPHLTGKRKLLIMGNHDRQRFSFYRDSGFQLVKPFSIDVATVGFPPQLVSVPPAGTEEADWTISFSHYPWNLPEEGLQRQRDIRLHGHIHNNGYTRDAYVPFLRNHINVSAEQTHYRPVNLKLLLEGALLGIYPLDSGQRAAREAKNGSG